MRRLATIAGSVALLALPATAVAEPQATPVNPPPNDSRATAAPVAALPATVSGTTVGATDDATDPRTDCGRVRDTVWYRLGAAQAGRIVVRVNALGDLDAVVSVYRAVRSRLTPVGCAPTDDSGRGALSFTSSGGDYLIMVGRERTSDDGRFRLTVFRQEPTSKAPGRALPRAGVASWVEPITDYDDAWSLRMKAGAEYRINLSPARGRCIALALFAPGTRSFTGASPLQLLPCGGYFTYTPGLGGSGRYSLLVTATDQRAGRQRYHLQAAAAGPDDMAPGLPLRDLQTRTGTLAGTRVDVVDLYRFHVDARSDVTLTLRGPASARLVVVNENGRRISSSGGPGPLTSSLGRGTYFAAVRADDGAHGRYRLSLLERGLTTTSVLVNGSRSATVAAGAFVSIGVDVRFSAAGAVRLELDRFDPLSGWHFYRLYRLRLGADGHTGVSWRPPTIGHWRVRASFGGTRTASPSDGGTARLVVSG
ncbi:MAG TPA: hypothetical protein VLD16_10640 [Gaiellaceae bacterium]|nr:hypothetical protein [Gaiellaceae bacterium]